METSTKVTSVIIALLVVIQGYQLVGDREPTHYCEERELKAYCYDLSSTMKTCYTLPAKTGGKRCIEWKEIPFLEEEKVIIKEDINEVISEGKVDYICPKRPNPCRKQP